MEKSTQMGVNRTGIDMSPMHSKAMISGARELTPDDSNLDGQLITAIRRQYIEAADAVGSVPMPGTIRGALKSAMDKFTGRNPEVLLNKLGERLAFERSGVRLYEAAIRKCEALGTTARIPLGDLKEIRDEEAEHFRILKEAIVSLGADPTAQTPDADVSGVAAMGFQKVLTDPRTTVSQCLEALLSLELADHAAWELLIALADEMELDELSDQFRHALSQEATHVRRVRNWYEHAVRAQLNRSRDMQH